MKVFATSVLQAAAFVVWGGDLQTGAGAVENALRPAVEAAEEVFHFEILGAAQPVEHVFVFKNNTSEILHPANVAVTKSLVFDDISSRVSPGEEGFVRVHLGSPRKLGLFEGSVEVKFKNAGLSNLVFQVTGTITPFIEVAPIPAFFLSVQRGQTNEASLQLINHEETPLQILGVEHTNSRFTTHVQTNEPGQRYTLSLTLGGDGEAGHTSEKILVRTSSRKQPVLRIAANTLIKERVNTFPDDVDFKSVNLAELRKNPDLIHLVSQTLMVYQGGGTNFELTAKISLPFLEVEAQPARTHDRWQITVRPRPEEMKPGSFEGVLVVETNDPEFARLGIPVRIVVNDEGTGSIERKLAQP